MTHDAMREVLEAERAELIAKNEAATSWGAAVGARHERIKEIDRALALTASVPKGEPAKPECNRSWDTAHECIRPDAGVGEGLSANDLCNFRRYGESLTVGTTQPLLLASTEGGIIIGKLISEVERLSPYQDELLKIAKDVGEPNDPFAAWERIAALSKPSDAGNASAEVRLREALERTRAILKGPHYQGGASLMAMGEAYSVVDKALSAGGDEAKKS